MYGLPVGFDPSPFVGRTVEQICSTENTAHIAFNEQIAITLESSFSYAIHEDVGLRVYRVPLDSTEVLRIIGKSVVKATVEGAGDLRLTFADNQVLVCHDDMPNFESYAIQIEDDRIVV